MDFPSKPEKLVVAVKEKTIIKRLRHTWKKTRCNKGFAVPAAVLATAIAVAAIAFCAVFLSGVLAKPSTTVDLNQTTRMAPATSTVKPVSPNDQQGGNGTSASEGDKESSSKTLKKTLKTADDKKFTVTVTFDEKAGIPDNAELSIIEYNLEPQEEGWQEDSKYKDRPYETELFLNKDQMEAYVEALSKGIDVQEDDYVFYTKFLDITIVSAGSTVQPKSDIDVTIETDAIDRAAASSIEIASVKGVDSKTHKKIFESCEVEDETTKDDGVKFEFSTSRVGEFGLAGVAEPKATLQLESYDVTVLGPHDASVYLADAYVNGVDDDLQLLGTFRAQVDPDPSYGTTLWVSATATDDSNEDQSVLEGYLIQDGALDKKIFTYEKAETPVPFDSDDGIAFVSEAVVDDNGETSEDADEGDGEEPDTLDSTLRDLPAQIQSNLPLFGMLRAQGDDDPLVVPSSPFMEVRTLCYTKGDFEHAEEIYAGQYAFQQYGWDASVQYSITHISDEGRQRLQEQKYAYEGARINGDERNVVSINTDGTSYKVEGVDEPQPMPNNPVLTVYYSKTCLHVTTLYYTMGDIEHAATAYDDTYTFNPNDNQDIGIPNSLTHGKEQVPSGYYYEAARINGDERNVVSINRNGSYMVEGVSEPQEMPANAVLTFYYRKTRLNVHTMTYEKGDYEHAEYEYTAVYTFTPYEWDVNVQDRLPHGSTIISMNYEYGFANIGDDTRNVVSVSTDGTYKVEGVNEPQTIPEGADLYVYYYKSPIWVPIYWVKESADGTLTKMSHLETLHYLYDLQGAYPFYYIPCTHPISLSTSNSGGYIWTPSALPDGWPKPSNSMPLIKYGFGMDYGFDDEGVCRQSADIYREELEETEDIYIQNTPYGIVASPNSDLTDGKTFSGSSFAIYIIYGVDDPNSYICKIGNNRFKSLGAAMSTVPEEGTATIEMLVDYTIPEGDTLSIPAGCDITLTTASKTGASGFTYRGSGTRAVLTRKSNNANPLITVNGTSGSNTTLTLENIGFNGVEKELSSGGSVVRAKNANVILGSSVSDGTAEQKRAAGVVIRNAKSSSQGGAICAVNSVVDISDSTFESCIKTGTGNDSESAYSVIDAYRGGGAVWTSGDSITVDNCIFNGCESAWRGGAIATTAGLLNISNSSFTTCKTTNASKKQGEGGAVFHQSNLGTYEAVIDNCQFEDCEATGSGGAVQTHAKNNTDNPIDPGEYAAKVTNSQFIRCRAGKQAGGLNCWEGSSVYVSNCAFSNCWSWGSAGSRPAGAACIKASKKAYYVGCSFNECFTKPANAPGGALYIYDFNTTKYGVTIEGCEFYDCRARFEQKNSNGGAICTETNTIVQDTVIQGRTESDWSSFGDKKLDNKNADKGGGIYVISGNTTIKGDTIIKSCRANQGGAVYVQKGATLEIQGGTISGNTSSNNGAGIYLAQGSTLNLKGSPSFGGSGIDGDGNIDSEVGNIKDGSLNATNGWMPYIRARQDIYLDKDTNEPTSINLVGDLTSPNGSIWVWADNSNLYEQSKAFAKMDRSKLTSANNLRAFRNAREDKPTGNNTNTYLYGITGSNNLYVYWGVAEGSCDVVLKKIDSDNQTLMGAVFKIYQAGDSTPFSVVEDGEIKNTFTSDEYGVYYVGEMTYGTYYINEITTPAGVATNGNTGWWYTLTVSESGVTISDQLSSDPR